MRALCYLGECFAYSTVDIKPASAAVGASGMRAGKKCRQLLVDRISLNSLLCYTLAAINFAGRRRHASASST